MFSLRIKFFFMVCAVFVSVSLFVWSVFVIRGHEKELRISFLDVGQGDAIFIQSPDGEQLLIDGGPNKKVLSELGKVMPFYDRSIDMVVATHSDADHIGGLPDVLERYEVEYIFDSAVVSDSSLFDTWQRAIQKENATYTHLYRGARVVLDENIWFDVLYPPKEGIEKKKANEASIVAKLTYRNACIILTGDIERIGELELLNDDIDCDVLKVAHHGSKTSTSDAFLQAVSPAVAVISSGKENRYGHPHQVILNKLQTAGISLLRTDEVGAITLISDGEKLWVE